MSALGSGSPAVAEVLPKPRSQNRELGHPVRLLALILLALIVAAAVAVVASGHWHYATQDRALVDAAASARHWTGTDELGRDRTVRLSLALVIALCGATLAALLATGLGAAIGIAAGSSRPVVRSVLLYASDLFLTLPWLFLLMIVRSALPLNLAPAGSAAVTFALLGLLGWPVFARMNAARTAAVRRSGWMLQGLACGLRPGQLLRAHVLPHLRPLLLSQFLVFLPIGIAAEANLGTLGLGVAEPLPSLGTMLLELRRTALLGTTRWAYLPLALLVLVLLLLEMTVFEEER